MGRENRGFRGSGGLIIMALLLYPFWLLVSENVDRQHLFVGLLVTLPTAYFWRDLVQEKLPGGKRLLRKTWLVLLYFFCLGREIVLANLAVARIILDPRLPIKPQIVTYKTPLQSDLARTLFCNSITLTPGTLTLDIAADGEIKVHALTTAAAGGIEDWYLEKLLTELEADEGND